MSHVCVVLLTRSVSILTSSVRQNRPGNLASSSFDTSSSVLYWEKRHFKILWVPCGNDQLLILGDDDDTVDGDVDNKDNNHKNNDHLMI